ncbi:hypothetical protein NC652_040128 [Populus alba x Populus x berolinensis]|nr:hypothetical protein NC652_040128 [Populus alba x Populus x berolinensis]
MKLYRGSMRKIDIPAMQGGEGLLHFQWLDRNLNVVEHDRIIFSEEAVFEKVNQVLGRVYILKFNTDDQKFFIWMQARSQKIKMIHNCVTLSTIILIVHLHSFKSEVFPLATLLLYLVVWQSSLMKEEPDASTPFHVFEDMLEDNISSRTGNLVVPDLGVEVMSDVTFSSGPVDPHGVMIYVAGSSGDPDEGDILKA